ncbi:flavin reductase family protein [Rhodococcus opacus]|uniref:flavin reductase family protein n=1 Tax=Rhodococcus opacus TaxID=37919 RepID=UPI000AC3A420|nr:flavin reductase family protein [Rhodococcus opacus]
MPSPGSPRLAGAHAWIDCHIDLVQPVGDHDLALELGATDTPDPLLLYTSTFHQLTPASPA